MEHLDNVTEARYFAEELQRNEQMGQELDPQGEQEKEDCEYEGIVDHPDYPDLNIEELEDEIALDEAKENEMYKNKVLNSLEKSVDSLSECPLKVKGKIFINYVSFYFLFSDQQYRCVRSCNAIFKCKKNA